MKKTFAFLFILLFVISFSQIRPVKVNRFEYELTYKIDSTNLNDVRRSTMFLDIADSKSRFGEDAELIKDSTLYAASSGSGVGAFSMMGRVRPKLKTVVYKDSKNQSISL